MMVGKSKIMFQAVIEVMFNQILRIKESGEGKEGMERFFSFPSFLSFLSMTVLMFICVACSNSPVEENDQHIETPDLEKILKDMVLIPSGEFLMGSPEGEGAFDEHPQHKVYLDAFYIDKYEVTNAQFKEFVEATGYVTDAERKGYGEVWNPKWALHDFADVNWRSPNEWRIPEYFAYNLQHPDAWKYYQMNHPVVQVSWNDALVYATWVGKRLPTEAEWEKAARGTDGRKYPWGNVFNADIKGVTLHTNIASDYLMPVGSFPTGISPYAVYDMTGNVQEWVADWYAGDYYARSPINNPKGPDNGVARVLRGGSWRHQKSYQVQNANREYQAPDYSSNFVGFRCAWNP
jgi:formylglycine-generating enzyme required for sulfatase activity